MTDLLGLELRQWSVGAVYLLVQTASVAEIMTSSISPPERRRRGTTVDAFSTFRWEVTDAICVKCHHYE